MTTAPVLLPRWIFSFTKKDAASEPIPEDLSSLSDEDLSGISTRLSEEFDQLYDGFPELAPTQQAERLPRLEELTAELERVKGESDTREAAAGENVGKAAELAARVHGTPEAEAEAAPAAPAPEAIAASEADTETAIAPATVALSADQFEQLLAKVAVAPAAPEAGDDGPMKIPAETLLASGRPRLNIPLSEVRRRAPHVDVDSRPDIIVAAASDIPGVSSGSHFDGIEEIADAMQTRARTLQAVEGGTRAPIAQIQRSFPDIMTLSENATPEQMYEAIAQATDPSLLVASGGWCAPSEILYNLFNITGEDGMIDLPTVGISRGGIRFPVSPTLAQVLGDVWTWSETDDQLAVTGAGTKPCFRADCPTFTDVRLDFDGICVTAGNLTERAFPELIRNFVALVMSAHFHAMNKRRIDRLVALSTGVTVANSGAGAVAPLLNAVELQATDYRQKFGMLLDDVLEVALPDWAQGVLRADLARQWGDLDRYSVTDAQLNAWFDARSVRVQWLNDYQVRGAGAAGTATPGGSSALTAWPQTVNFLIYAAGTFLLGNGPTIDLGVVRDSVLNAKNDHTAAWSEEGHLIAMVGHESRNVTVPICPDGSNGPAHAFTCPIA